MAEQINKFVDSEVLAAFDIDNEAPAQEPAPADTPPAEEAPAADPAPEAPTTDATAPPPAEVASTGEPTAEAPAEAPVDWEKRYKDLQSHKDKQLNEVQAELNAFRNVMEQLSQPPVQEPQFIEVSDEDLEAGVDSAPLDVFQWALYNRPDLVPTVISKTREKRGNDLADKMLVTYNQAIVMAQQEAYQQQMYEQQYPAMVHNVLEQGVDQVANEYGDDFVRMATRTNELMQQNREHLQSLDPHSIRNFVERNFLLAMREEQIAQAAAPKGPAVVPPAESVEAGTPGQAPAPTPNDDIADSIVEAHNATKLVW